MLKNVADLINPCFSLSCRNYYIIMFSLYMHTIFIALIMGLSCGILGKINNYHYQIPAGEIISIWLNNL